MLTPFLVVAFPALHGAAMWRCAAELLPRGLPRAGSLDKACVFAYYHGTGLAFPMVDREPWLTPRTDVPLADRRLAGTRMFGAE